MLTQKKNVAGLRKLVTEINKEGEGRALIGPVEAAIDGASKPSIAPVKTTTKIIKLTLGDMDEFPDESLSFEVEVQKAVQKASAKSMQKMRKGAWARKHPSTNRTEAASGKKRRRNDEEEDDDQAEEGDGDDKHSVYAPGAIAAEKVCRIFVPD